ncbi:NAD-dependent epimerase/dehydratase family protein [Leptolyngbyaceae cyanobacterium CCMR0082]|uniref:NAD-dependent epimerase/dehydratase family protein n=2 Tax=Adonisia turfae TaxID=2950184 RepID=A0A6M0SAH8_9CYAN|nr:SDR family oxidoreductase [Adonisia turfae]MDV3350726.1 SDR family oxidoreductase [Leptothoe sp. LEGE 181152]NEZ61081.1 NAD-dependent epimerase/dehydratase family protein [Adonisia turfae CCMR0081]NEZ65474.1 NAD-dependent epimerase/dehydratase family protein [Adonisia turfae CCMR0082]
MSILVVGATGTLGRQIVRNALDEGFDVKCLVRNFQKAAFLREWGAQLVQANLCGPKSLPPCFDDVTAVIDAATSRPQDSAYDVDWDGKVNLIKAAVDAKVERYVFISILNCEKYPHVPLMDIKHCTEKFLEESGINYTILRPCGFLQGLVGQYAIPLLEKQAIWVMGEAAPIAYMNTQDIARFAVRSLQLPETGKRSFPLAGTRAWGAYELVRLCERLSGEDAKVSTMSLGLLRGVRSFANFFQWGWQFADRLAFAEVSAGSEPLDAEMDEVYSTFGLDKSETTTVEEYMGEYFNRILKKLKEMDFESSRESKKKLPF